jgi:hypothetical protein
MSNCNIEFHEPDPRWEMFGCPDFESYLKHYLVRGQFHNKVPEEITKAYLTIENLIAHAYYYYPMYDEAISKALRTMEMAVKIRCKDLGIPVDRPDKKGKHKKIDRKFVDLIRDLAKSEPGKDVFYLIDCYRTLRNSLMHPETNSYMGGIGKPTIINSVNIFNLLFAPASFFELNKKQTEKLQQQTLFMKGEPLVFKMNNTRFLIHAIEITDVFINGESESVCLHVVPISNLPDNPTEDLGYAEPFTLFVRNIAIQNQILKGINIPNNSEIEVQISKHPDDKESVNKYLEYLDKFYKRIYPNVEQIFTHNKGKGIAEFRYSHYHQIQF